MKLSFTRHIHDLLRRLEWLVLVLVAGSFLAYFVRGGLMDLLQAPLLHGLPYGPLNTPVEFSSAAYLLVGVLVSIPVGMLQLVSALRPVSRAQAVKLVVASAGLVVFGVAFAYVVLPPILQTLSGVRIADFRPLVLADSYLLFVINYLGVAAIACQLPLLLLVVDRVRPLPLATLKAWQKWVALGAVVGCFILPTAPEPLTQLVIALVVILAYELSLAAVILERYRRRPVAAPALAPARAAAPAPRPIPVQPVPAARPRPKPRPAARGPIDLRKEG